MLAAVRHPSVRILAHPRGRITGSRAGVIAQWPVVFAAAAERGVAVEIDGDPARQDFDYNLAATALDAGCLLRWTAMPIPLVSWLMRRLPSRMPGSPVFRRIGSSTAGLSIVCSHGSPIQCESVWTQRTVELTYLRQSRQRCSMSSTERRSHPRAAKKKSKPSVLCHFVVPRPFLGPGSSGFSPPERFRQRRIARTACRDARVPAGV